MKNKAVAALKESVRLAKGAKPHKGGSGRPGPFICATVGLRVVDMEEVLALVAKQQAQLKKLRAQLKDSVPRTTAMDALWRMSNWQHGYGQNKLANSFDVTRCLETTITESKKAKP